MEIKEFSIAIVQKSSLHLHCKYFGCTQYSFWLCSISQCNLAVLITTDDSALPMAVMNLNCSEKKQFFVVLSFHCTAFSISNQSHRHQYLKKKSFYFTTSYDSTYRIIQWSLIHLIVQFKVLFGTAYSFWQCSISQCQQAVNHADNDCNKQSF